MTVRHAKNKSVFLSQADKQAQVASHRDELVRAEIARERAAVDAKTEKLRALRLAKEEADRAAKAEFDAAFPLPTQRPKARRSKVAP